MTSRFADHPSTEKSGAHFEPVKLSCPACGKRYVTHRNHAQKIGSRFQCSACQTVFSAMIPETPDANSLETFAVKLPPVQTPTLNAAALPLPLKSNRDLRMQTLSSESAELMVDEGPGADLWRMVLADYQQEGAHQEFVRACTVQGLLPFAASRYQRILDILPSDERAQRMVQQIQVLATVPLLDLASPQRDYEHRIPRLTSLVFFLSGMALAVGLVVPVVSNEIRMMTGWALVLTLLLIFALRPLRAP